MGGLAVADFANFNGVNLLTNVFIETGTFRGGTLRSAIEAGFAEVHSIDVVPEYTENARNMWFQNPSIHLHNGTSPDVLPTIMDGTKHTTFWLDGHFQAHLPNESCEKYGECPVLAELKVIFSIDWKVPPIVLIDDANMFTNGCGSKFKASDWPSLNQIKEMLPVGYETEIARDTIIITKDVVKIQ